MTDSRKTFQDQMQRMTDELEPEEALEVLGSSLRNLIAQLDEEERVNYILGLLGAEDSDKVSSMVHL
jgi:hypothetical protein